MIKINKNSFWRSKEYDEREILQMYGSINGIYYLRNNLNNKYKNKKVL